MTIPYDNQLEFFMHPVVFGALIVGMIIIILTIINLKIEKSRPFFRGLFKIYYVIAFIPLYAAAGIVYAVTLSKVNLFEKFKEIQFQEKFKKIHLEPKVAFEDMRTNPTNYHFWAGLYICIVAIACDYILISTLIYTYYGGRESIIFGILSTHGPITDNPMIFAMYRLISGNLVWFPTKFTIYFLVLAFHKYDKSDDPDRPWWDKVRLTYIAWGYIIAADFIWCVGMLISVIVSIFIPSWEVLFFTWVFIIICGIMEMTYQQFSLHGLFKLGWAKGFIIWLTSMIPFALATFLIIDPLGLIILN